MGNPSPFHFPCEFEIKLFGSASDSFEHAALSIIRKHVPFLRENAIRTRLSKDGNYLALTVTITADSKEQLDRLYHELSAHPEILMAL